MGGSAVVKRRGEGVGLAAQAVKTEKRGGKLLSFSMLGALVHNPENLSG